MDKLAKLPGKSLWLEQRQMRTIYGEIKTSIRGLSDGVDSDIWVDNEFLNVERWYLLFFPASCWPLVVVAPGCVCTGQWHCTGTSCSHTDTSGECSHLDWCFQSAAAARFRLISSTSKDTGAGRHLFSLYSLSFPWSERSLDLPGIKKHEAITSCLDISGKFKGVNIFKPPQARCCRV